MEEDDEYWMEEDSGSDGGELDFDEEGGAQVRERTRLPPPPTHSTTPPFPPTHAAPDPTHLPPPVQLHGSPEVARTGPCRAGSGADEGGGGGAALGNRTSAGGGRRAASSLKPTPTRTCGRKCNS